MIHRDVPYDAEIEYLQPADSGQYIDTGIGGLSLISFDITMSLYEETPSTYDFVFGMWPTTTSGYGLQILLQNSGIVAPTGRNSFSLSGISAGTALTVGQKYSFTVNQTRTTSSNTFYLFARNYGNVAQATAHHYRIYALKIRQGGNVVRDFIPVRVGNIGYMYDKVSGQLFGNAGTGSFVLGPDVAPGRYANEVAFLESWGNQYIDTGIKPSTDTKIELKCLYCKSGAGLTSYGSLIGADDRSNAYILNHSAVANFTYGLEFSNNFANPQTRLLTFNSTAAPQNMRVYDEGGSLVTTLTCIRGVFEVNQSLYLFAVNRNGTPVYGSNRILYCKIYDGDTLVRDYVPVEYNGIGYMYDKVSGLFFDNKGTGKFLFGSIAKACARSYTRRQLMADTVLPKPYISDGLVFHLDGADATDTTWVDRIGGNTFTNDGSATHDGKGVRGTYSSPTAFGPYVGNGTIEVCGEIISSWGAANNTVHIVQDKEHIRGINYIIKPRANPPYATIDSRSGWGNAPRAYRSVGLGKFTHSVNVVRHVFNGTLGELGSNTYDTTNAPSSIIGHTKVRIYQVRIYNRLLTEAEMKYNQEQDRKKYGIQF